LLAIKAHDAPEPMTIKALAERLLLQPNSAFELTDRLEAAGLISRSRSPTDRRRTLVQLTDHADQLISGLAESHREELKRLGPALTEGLRGILEGAHKAAPGENRPA
jgi:DNA-binding MarR family transcriptional regulator